MQFDRGKLTSQRPRPCTPNRETGGGRMGRLNRPLKLHGEAPEHGDDVPAEVVDPGLAPPRDPLRLLIEEDSVARQISRPLRNSHLLEKTSSRGEPPNDALGLPGNLLHDVARRLRPRYQAHALTGPQRQGVDVAFCVRARRVGLIANDRPDRA